MSRGFSPTLSDRELPKIYWDIGEVARHFEVTTGKIRYWSDKFKLTLARAGNRKRRFSEQNIADIARIYHLLRVRKFRLEGAIQEFYHPQS